MRETFEQYQERNPRIYKEFVHYAFELINAGETKIGSKSIFEQIRWQSKIKKDGEFKVNNNYTADYARKFEQDHPHLAGIFEKRVCKIR
jgi:hypothetical protein